MKERLVYLYFFVSILFIAPSMVAAHATGISYEKVLEKYTIDVGYSSDTITQGDRLLLDFNLKDTHTKEYIPFESVWVRVVQNTKTVLATGVAHARLGATTLIFTPPEVGDLTIEIRYEDVRGDVLAEGSISVSVARGSGLDWKLVSSVIEGVLIIGGVVFVYSQRKTNV